MFKKAVVSPLKATLSFVGSCVGLAVAVAVVYLLVAHYSSLFVHSVESAPEGHMLLGIFVAGAVLILVVWRTT